MNSSSNFRSTSDCRIDRLCAEARMVALSLRRIGIVLLQVTEDTSKYPIIIGKELAHCGFRKVFECNLVEGGKKFAVKTLNFLRIDLDLIQMEIKSMHALRHISIVVQLEAVFFDMEQCVVHIIMELMDCGSLSAVMKKVHQPLPPIVIQYIVSQMTLGLDAIHRAGFIHRDIKPDNVLLNTNGEVKIGDLGLTSDLSRRYVWGTSRYKSPEKARGINSTDKADIWALGMTLLEMVGQVFPHSSILDITAIEKCIASYTDADISSILDTASIFSEDCRDFIKRCLRVNPEERASIAELLQHPFVTGVPENARQSLIELLASLKIVVLEKTNSHTQPPPPPDCQRDFRKVPVRYEDPNKEYDSKKRIGKGGSGTVYSGFCKKSGKHVAIKKTPSGDFAMHEVSVWSAIPQHPNVVGLIEVFVWENYVYAVMELMSSNLASIIPIPKRHMPMLPSLMILRIIRQLICGLLHLHTNHIAHGDIKSDNVLLDTDGNVKLVDFGVSTQHGEPHFNAPYCGTFSWKSPNAMTASQSPFKDDIWSLGITIMELFGIDPPFFNVVDQRELVRLIRELQAPPQLPDLKNYGEDFKLRMHRLLEVCFYMNSADRFSAEEFLEFFDMIFPDVSSLKN